MARIRNSRWGRWIGGLSSAGVVAGAYAAPGALALADEDLAQAGAVAALAVVVAHVLLRRPGRRDHVVRLAAIPGWTAMLVEAITGWPAWAIVAPLVVIVVVLLAAEERRERAQPA